jgi:hypothetical protein
MKIKCLADTTVSASTTYTGSAVRFDYSPFEGELMLQYNCTVATTAPTSISIEGRYHPDLDWVTISGVLVNPTGDMLNISYAPELRVVLINSTDPCTLKVFIGR